MSAAQRLSTAYRLQPGQTVYDLPADEKVEYYKDNRTGEYVAMRRAEGTEAIEAPEADMTVVKRTDWYKHRILKLLKATPGALRSAGEAAWSGAKKVGGASAELAHDVAQGGKVLGREAWDFGVETAMKHRVAATSVAVAGVLALGGIMTYAAVKSHNVYEETIQQLDVLAAQNKRGGLTEEKLREKLENVIAANEFWLGDIGGRNAHVHVENLLKTNLGSLSRR